MKPILNKEQSMNVCHVLFELRLGGIGAMLQNYALALKPHDHMTCVIFRMSDDPIILSRYDALLSHPQVNTVLIDKRVKKDYLKTLLALYKLFKIQQFDMVFSHLEEVTRYLWWIPMFSSNKLTQVIHNEDYHDEWLHKKWFKHFLSGIIYVSNSSMSKHHVHAVQKVIHNGIAPSKLILKQRQGFIFVGRLESQKDPTKCLRMYHQAINQCENPWPLTMIGNGSYQALVRGTINQLNLQAHVTYIESTQDVQSWFASSLCGLMTSSYEGYPMVLLEASQQGCPYISYDVGDVKDIIQESGWLIKPNDEDAFVTTMVSLMKDPSMVEKASINARIQSENFSAHKMVQEYENWIKERTHS
jgi:glycosyltransferase involved in cell wall biosynthesis